MRIYISTAGNLKCAMIKGTHRPRAARTQKLEDELSFSVFETDAQWCRVKAFSRSRFITRQKK